MAEPVSAQTLDVARRVTLRYLWASTAILLASGLLGALLRASQADLGRLDDSTFYAVMTAHGLGAFLGWAGFAVMGFAWWALASVGFPLRPLGAFLARLTWWLMVLGVAGVLVTTLLLGFGGSWVFLYPLPFHAAGEWGEWTTAIFSASVLLVGLSIVTWCLGILHTVLGPSLHATSHNVFNRAGVAMGFGYLWPRRFPTNPENVPYVVIPLTVIAIDMIIATLPLAVLLVEMIVQSFDPGVTVDPLLAKNVLWWFGHPVVYLLLFPAVALYYLLVPRFAGRPLVAGNVIAVAWVVAVITNVLVWAHHIYLDYPEGSPQAAINTAMQPLTFALTIPSALSLYSLGLTIYRSPTWRWTGATWALFLGLVSWLLAGLSGVVNATIAFDAVIHNTLWVVGHFHHMALLNIGLLVFAAVYAFLPELLGRPLYSDALAKWHVWLTFVGGTGNSAIWMVEGLDGTPRRFAVPPDGYLDLSRLSLVAVAMLALGQVLFVWNLGQTVRARSTRVRDAGRESRRGPAFEGAVVLAVLTLAFAATAAGFAIGRSRSDSATPTRAPEEPAGTAVFEQAGCGSCHTFAPAGATGTIGPDLGATSLSADEIRAVVTNGRGGMPAFGDRLTDAEIEAVADYVEHR